MVSLAGLQFLCAFVVALALGVNAENHFKRQHRFPHHRNECRPRLNLTSEYPLHSHPASSVVLVVETAAASTHSIPSSAYHSPPTKSITSTVLSTSHSTSVQARTTSHPTTTPISTKSASSTKATTTTTQVSAPLASSLTPNGIKAGIAGGDSYPFVKDHIGWWYDWSPTPSKAGKPIAVPMLWGGGTTDAQDAQRLQAFENLSTTPMYVLGYEEPDCPSGSGSAGMSVQDGVKKWEELIAPMGKKGAKLGSPSMCKQADETWLKQFVAANPVPFDFTAIHINKNNMDGVRKDLDYYSKTYNKPIWVTEFACVNDVNGFVPCTDQGEIDTYINNIVDVLESDNRVFAYAYSNGEGLGDVWPMMNGNSLSESGRTYLSAISKYH